MHVDATVFIWVPTQTPAPIGIHLLSKVRSCNMPQNQWHVCCAHNSAQKHMALLPWGITAWTISLYKSELTLAHYLSDIFGQWCGLNIHPMRPGQHCTALWGYLKGFKSSSTSPQNGAKAAAIAMLFNTKIGIMVQSPIHRSWYIFYGVKNVRYWQHNEFPKKNSQHAQFSVLRSKVRADYLTLCIQQFFVQMRRLVCRNTTPH